MNAFRILEITEGKVKADAFKEYFEKLDLKPDIKEKITKFDLGSPFSINGFHPAFNLHMLNYNNSLK